MANDKHAVVRTDEMAGTINTTFLKSAKFYANDAEAEIDNGNLVVVTEKLDREVFKATAPTSTSVRGDIYVVAGVEMFYDDTVTHYLTEWVNEAGKAVRLYQLTGNGTFSVTEEAFDGTPVVGQYADFAADSTKIKVSAAKSDKTIGKITHTETTGYGDGKYTYYMIDLC